MTGSKRDLEKRLEELREQDDDETPDNLADLILEMSKEENDGK